MRLIRILIFLGLILSQNVSGQLNNSSLNQDEIFNINPIKFPKIKLKKTGPYFGYERGKIDVFEIGGEHQRKKIRLRNPITHGFHGGFNYNFKYHVMGFEAGYWYKESRVGLTFGGSLVLRTNFDQTRFGASPMLGFRLLGFHLQAGYHFLTKADPFTETNTFFIRLRFTLVNDRDIDIKK